MAAGVVVVISLLAKNLWGILPLEIRSAVPVVIYMPDRREIKEQC